MGIGASPLPDDARLAMRRSSRPVAARVTDRTLGGALLICDARPERRTDQRLSSRTGRRVPGASTRFQ